MAARTVCFQRWHDLLFLHWPASPAAVRPLVPAALALDLWEARAWIAVVAFGIRDARVPAAPPRTGLDFLETNVRTYVRGPGGEPAVWFFSLDAASRLAVIGARWRYGLPYHVARMRLARTGDTIAYETARAAEPAARLVVRYRPGPEVGPAPPGTLDHFLHERYRLHALRRGRPVEVAVRHAPYALHAAEVRTLEDGLRAAEGLPASAAPPRATWCPGVDVAIVS